MMIPLHPALVAHAEALLIGTGLTGQDAAAVAAGSRPAPATASTAAAALRDGWDTAESTVDPR